MPKTWMCPFWQYEQGGVMKCEGAKLHFCSHDVRLEFAQTFCACVPGWEQCPMARALLRRWEGSV